MTGSKKTMGYTREADARVRDIRRGPGQSAGLMGYQPGGAQGPRPFPGDVRFPYVMQPPDLDETTFYKEGELPLVQVATVDTVSSLAVLPSIDVRGWRSLALHIDVDAEPSTFLAGYQAAIVPQASYTVEAVQPLPNKPVPFEDTWRCVGVLDATLHTGGSLSSLTPPLPLMPLLFALRNAHMTQINLPVGIQAVASQPPLPFATTLVFDVSPYARYRFLAGLYYPDMEPPPEPEQPSARFRFHYTLSR